VDYVCFSPTDPQHIISISGGKVWEWDINSQDISSSYDATSLAFSPDHSQLALCCGEMIVVRNLSSGAIIAQSKIVDKTIQPLLFLS
jgi:WD40 repeat protein